MCVSVILFVSARLCMCVCVCVLVCLNMCGSVGVWDVLVWGLEWLSMRLFILLYMRGVGVS